jgi:hypothetical protein
MAEIIKQYTFQTISSNNSNTSNPFYFLSSSPGDNGGFSVGNFTGIQCVNLIDSRNNTLQFSETDTSSTTRVVKIPTGDYTLSTLLTAIGAGMTSAGTVTYTATVNSLTNLITISSSKAFKIFTASNNIYYEIGYSTSSAFATSQTASKIYDLSGLKQIHIVSSSFGASNSILVNTNYTVICSIPISSPFLGVIRDEPSPQFIDSQINDLNSISFSLLDERKRTLTMSKDWSLQIYFRLN